MIYKGTFEKLKNIILKTGYEIIEIKLTPHSSKNPVYYIRTSEGGVINWYESTGKINVQGSPATREKLQEKLKEELPHHIEEKSLNSSPKTPLLPPPSPEVFIVHGHDSNTLRDLQLILSKLGVKYQILQNTSGNGLTIIEALEEEICAQNHSIKFGIVLLTPDDMGYAKTDGPQKAQPRARQNVILEMGMLMPVLSRKNVAILLKQGVERPSDIEGIIYIPFNNQVSETIAKLVQRLRSSGFKIDSEAMTDALIQFEQRSHIDFGTHSIPL
ncbi:TIR domain-containing protein [Bartonella machadoae]|uniref:TIR domain-containing protein n=1 Tax=Bartonella machadoae TaxID=2893471 RepID=UPI001F4D351E|nr:TIR domain-containing protein [Bartonella machadoae]UNE54004.1 nucleotide-binding protein [Bartonella machadoae]